MIDTNPVSVIQYSRHLLSSVSNLFKVLPLIVFGTILVSCSSATSTAEEATEVSNDAEVADDVEETTPSTTSAPTVEDQQDAASSSDDVAEDDATEGDGTFPDVIAAEATQDGDGSWTFAVTISSPYDSPERYADAWRVSNSDGEVYGIRELTHDHASEQPFTRTKSGIEIPEDVTEVTVSGRDQLNGWGGGTATVVLR